LARTIHPFISPLVRAKTNPICLLLLKSSSANAEKRKSIHRTTATSRFRSPPAHSTQIVARCSASRYILPCNNFAKSWTLYDIRPFPFAADAVLLVKKSDFVSSLMRGNVEFAPLRRGSVFLMGIDQKRVG